MKIVNVLWALIVFGLGYVLIQKWLKYKRRMLLMQKHSDVCTASDPLCKPNECESHVVVAASPSASLKSDEANQNTTTSSTSEVAVLDDLSCTKSITSQGSVTVSESNSLVFSPSESASWVQWAESGLHDKYWLAFCKVSFIEDITDGYFWLGLCEKRSYSDSNQDEDLLTGKHEGCKLAFSKNMLRVIENGDEIHQVTLTEAPKTVLIECQEGSYQVSINEKSTIIFEPKHKLQGCNFACGTYKFSGSMSEWKFRALN